jgi:hypothetical protein
MRAFFCLKVCHKILNAYLGPRVRPSARYSPRCGIGLAPSLMSRLILINGSDGHPSCDLYGSRCCQFHQNERKR